MKSQSSRQEVVETSIGKIIVSIDDDCKNVTLRFHPEGCKDAFDIASAEVSENGDGVQCLGVYEYYPYNRFENALTEFYSLDELKAMTNEN